MRHRGLKSPGAPEASVNTDGTGCGPLHHRHSSRLWGPCLGLVLLPLWTYIDSYLQTVMPNRSSLCPHFTDPFPRWEVWSQGLSRQAGLWSVLPPLVTLSLPQVQLAHLVHSSNLSSQRMTRRGKSKILLNQ